MKIARECIPCLARQATQIAEEATACPKLQEEIIKASLQELANLSFDFMATEIAHKMHHHARRVTGVIDPYKELKQMYNAVALEIAEMLREDNRVENSPSPFDTACRISIAGNIIDFSAGLTLGYEEVRRSVEESLEKPLFGVGTAALEEAVGKATSILFLADNSGEIVFDRFLIEMLPLDRVTVVVKGGPIVNDATMEDAVVAGLTDMVKVIDNGHDAQGTILSACSQPFLQALSKPIS